MKEVVPTRRWKKGYTWAFGSGRSSSVLVYEVWSGMNKIGTFKRRKHAKKRAKQ